MKNPCDRCEKRDAYCHATCPDYIDYQTKNNHRREIKRREREINRYLTARKKGIRIENFRKSCEK